jgi:hypothetical protein
MNAEGLRSSATATTANFDINSYYIPRQSRSATARSSFENLENKYNLEGFGSERKRVHKVHIVSSLIRCESLPFPSLHDGGKN